ncbi:MAG: maleylpyruvate isomerase family mycothiol-dependent enzyme [Nitrospinae bacterium]|nr:maleylpyruvate isomerase family mycothiol-dependent enzyme [Nitrospinota bacterium]
MNDTPLLPAIRWLAHENARFIALLRALSETDWTKPTFCPGWNAAQLVGHMTGGAISYAERIQAARRGEVILSLGAGTPKEFQAAREEITRKSVAMSPPERVDWIEKCQNALQDEIERLEPGDLDRKLWHRKGDTRVRTFPDQRLYEVALHAWDLGNDLTSPLETDSLGMLVEILGTRLPLYFNRSGATGPAGVFRFETNKPHATWEISIAGGEASAVEGLSASPDAVLSASGSDMVLLVSGRADRAEKIAEGSLHIEGDAQKAAALMDVLFQPF